jgi:excinuclease ABC subunit C
MYPSLAFDPSSLPPSPGCFLLRDAQGKVIFVGKSTNLRRRLSELNQEKNIRGGTQRPHKRYLELGPELLAQIDSLEIILLHNDDECTFLINRLIERYHPTFNLATYIEPVGVGYIIQTGEPFPRLLPRGKKRISSTQADETVFGPFPGGPVRDLLLKTVSEEYGLRTCAPMPKKACLLADLKLCCAPCEGRVSADEYAQRVHAAEQIISTTPADLIEALEQQVQAAADRLEFERAGRLSTQLKQIIQGYRALAPLPPVEHTQDAIYTGQGLAVVARYVEGKLSAVEAYPAEGDIQQFIETFYLTGCPQEILCNEFPGAEQTAALLAQRCEQRVRISFPRAGSEEAQLDVARINHAWRVKTNPGCGFAEKDG